MSDPGASLPKPETIAKQADPPSSQDPLIGSLFDQRYQILAQYGSGATATAYKAHDNLLDRDVAVKIIHAHLLSNPRAVERFKTEAATTTALSHPNIAHVYKQGVASDGRLYIVMDCLEGESLAELIDKNGKLSLDIFFQIFTQIIEALKYAHEQGVIHRDIKPNNIVLVKEQKGYKAFLVDFGIAKCIDQNNEQSSTQTGALLGSSAYMSPEQCTGTNADFRSDIYSLACVMIESLMGESPFKGQSALDMMYQHLNESLSKLAFLKDIPGPISELLSRCIQKDPQKRFQSIDELKKDFLACAEMKDTLQRKWSTKNSKDSSANKMLIAGITALAVAVVCTFSYFYFLKNSTPMEPDSEILAATKSEDLDPNKERIPRALGAVDEIAQKYGDLNKRILLYDRWQKERSAQADLKEKVMVHIRLLDLYKALSNKKAAIDHASSVKKLTQENAPMQTDNKLLQGELVSFALDAYLRVNEPLEALEFTDEILKKYPSILHEPSNKFDIFTRQAYCYDLLEQTQKATELMKEAMKIARTSGLRPDQNPAREFLIVILCKQRKIAECEPIAEECLEAFQDSDRQRFLPSAYYNVANSFFIGKAYTESISWLKQTQEVAIKMGNKSVYAEATHLLLQSYRANADFVSATKLDKELLAGNLSWVEQMRSYSDLARDLQRTGEQNNCLSYAEKALEIAKDNLSSSQAQKIDAQLQLLTSVVAYRDLLDASNQAEKADQMLDGWIKLAETKLPNSYLLAKLYQSRAELFVWTNNNKIALDLIDKAVKIANKEKILRWDKYLICDLLCLKADCLGHAEKFKEKQKCAEQGLGVLSQLESSATRQVNLWLRLAEALRKQGKIAESDSISKQAEELLLHSHSPEDSLDQYRQLAQYYYNQNELAKAEQISKLAIEKAEKLGMGSSDSARVLLHCLQDSFYADKKYKEAVAAGKQAYELASKLKITDDISKAILKGLKCAYSALGHWDDSIQILEELLRVSAPEERGTVYGELLKSYKCTGETDKYKMTLEKALAATSGNSLDDRFSRVFIEIELCRSSLPADEIEANKHFQAALKIADSLPRNERKKLAADAYHGLAQMMVNQKKYSEAYKLFRTSNDIYKGCTAAMWYQRANLIEWKAACEAGGDKKQEEEVKQEIARLD